MSMTSALVNEGKYSLVHIKSGESRSGYDNIEDMIDDMVELYYLFKDIDSTKYGSIFEEFCVVAPLNMIDKIIIGLKDKLGEN